VLEVDSVDRAMCGRHEEAIERLNGWQKTQNGALLRLEGKVDRLNLWLIGLLGSVIANLALTVLRR